MRRMVSWGQMESWRWVALEGGGEGDCFHFVCFVLGVDTNREKKSHLDMEKNQQNQGHISLSNNRTLESNLIVSRLKIKKKRIVVKYRTRCRTNGSPLLVCKPRNEDGTRWYKKKRNANKNELRGVKRKKITSAARVSRSQIFHPFRS